MAWNDLIDIPLIITTGDGVEYQPLIKESNYTYSYAFNVSEFEFPEVIGTRVERLLKKSRRFPFEVFFDGANCVEDALKFEKSTEDIRPWSINHPFFKKLDGHPISLEFDYSGISSVRISFEFVESIKDDGPVTVLAKKETILNLADEQLQTNTDYLSENVAIEPDDIIGLQEQLTEVNNQSKNKLSIGDISTDYYNAFQTAYNSVSNAISDASNAFFQAQNFLSYPARFKQKVDVRIALLESQAKALTESAKNIVDSKSKRIFESNKSAVITAIVQSSVTPDESDYQNTNEVFNVIYKITDIYNSYILELSDMQTDYGWDVDSYLPDYNLQMKLNNLVNFALSNLLEIALTASQERVVYLEANSNPILLTHRFYGLDENDENLNKFINTNDLSIDELLFIEKGRKIIYYT